MKRPSSPSSVAWCRAAALAAAVPLLLGAHPLPADAAATGSAQPLTQTETQVHVRDLARRGRPAVSWLVGDVVHTPNGRTHRLPWTRRAAERRDLTLRGRTPAGWVVTDVEAGSGTHAWVVKGQDKREVDLASTSNDENTWWVARDGGSLLRRSWTEGDTSASELVRRLSDGTVVDDREFAPRGLVLDFTGDQALIATEDDSFLWEPGDDPTSVGVPSVAGSIAHDVLIVPGEASGMVGPTSLSQPGPPAWVAPLERVEISPDGRLLVGLVTGDRRGDGKHIEVRRMSDGEVLAAYHVRTLWRLTVQWENQRAILFQAARRGSGDVDGFVHCRLGGACTRATAWFRTRLLSAVRPPQITG